MTRGGKSRPDRPGRHRDITPDDVRKYRLGSILAGGNSDPRQRYNAAPQAWLALADAFCEASMDTSQRRQGDPGDLCGIDAVHGQSNIVGATLFPHNIGLGATRNPGTDARDRPKSPRSKPAPPAWNGRSRRPWRCRRTTAGAAPTKAIPRIPRWSRAAPAMVEGLQGKAGAKDFLDGHHVIAIGQAFPRRWRHHRRQGPGRYRRSAKPCCATCTRAGYPCRDRRRRADGDGLVQQRQRREDARQQAACSPTC